MNANDNRCLAAAATVIICGAELLLLNEFDENEEQRKKRQRTKWVREFFVNREQEGFYTRLNTMLRTNDPELFNNFLRMDASDFDLLLELVRPRIEKKDTHLRKSISAAERLAVTLRFLASGDSYGSLMFLFQMSKASIQHIIDETCEAIYEELKDQYLKVNINIFYTLMFKFKQNCYFESKVN